MVPRCEGLEESIKEPVHSTGCRQDASMPKIGAVEVVHFPNVLNFFNDKQRVVYDVFNTNEESSRPLMFKFGVISRSNNVSGYDTLIPRNIWSPP